MDDKGTNFDQDGKDFHHVVSVPVGMGYFLKLPSILYQVLSVPGNMYSLQHSLASILYCLGEVKEIVRQEVRINHCGSPSSASGVSLPHEGYAALQVVWCCRGRLWPAAFVQALLWVERGRVDRAGGAGCH